MVQTTNRFFDEVAKLMNDAAGVAQGVRREAETLFKARVAALEARLAGSNAPAGGAGGPSTPPGSGGPQESPGGHFA
jgi:BMFP domain-containing protein YqiC